LKGRIVLSGNGIWKIVYGQPEKMLPDQFKAASKTALLAAMSIENAPAVSLSKIQLKKTAAGITAEIDAAGDERFFRDFNNNKKYQGDSTHQISMGLMKYRSLSKTILLIILKNLIITGCRYHGRTTKEL